MSKEIQEEVKRVLRENEAHVYCATCGQEFLRMKLAAYVKLRNPPDKWFIETGIHWATNPDHVIMAQLPLPYSISDIWEKRRARDNLTQAAMLPYFLSAREENSHKFI